MEIFTYATGILTLILLQSAWVPQVLKEWRDEHVATSVRMLLLNIAGFVVYLVHLYLIDLPLIPTVSCLLSVFFCVLLLYLTFRKIRGK